MNIFALSESPELAAKYHCDKHVVKMIVETAQILASCHNISLGIETKKDLVNSKDKLSKYFHSFPRRKEDGSPDYYGLGYINHGCVRWAAESIENYNWLIRLGLHLCDEYYLRYGMEKNKQHSTKRIIEYFSYHLPNIPSTDEKTPFYLAVGDGFGNVTDGNGIVNAVETYRLYYVLKKSKICTWKISTPVWFEELYKKVYNEGWS